MEDHRPTLGSRLRVWRDPFSNKPTCAGCGGVWPCNPAIEATHAWQADGGPIPDGTDSPPLDFVQTAQGIYRLARGGAR